jgi:hypothetical protein
VYGKLGFTNAQELNERSSAIHRHNDPIDRQIYKREVLPWLSRLEEFFQPSIRDLQHMLGNFASQQVESVVKEQKQVRDAAGMNTVSTKTSFTQLLELAKLDSGNWSDVVELLSVMHKQL